MNKKYFTLTMILAFLMMAGSTFAQKQVYPTKAKKGQTKVVDTRIDNMTYWKSAAAEGLVPVEPATIATDAVYTGSKIKAFSVITEDSPDVPVSEATNITESENSIFADPSNSDFVLNSNNSTSWNGGSVGTLYGANGFFSDDGGLNWGGSAQGAGGSNSGDPATAINLDGSRMYVNYIANNYGMGVAHSTNGGSTWTHVQAAPNPGSLADKNHMWIDNSPTSPYEGNLYVAYTYFGGPHDAEIGMVSSSDGGMSWAANQEISSEVNAGSHCQGVHITTGPNGEVYAFFAIYDGWPTDEAAIGMAKSTDGGATWEPAVRIIDNIRGIRTTETSKNHRVNSFPVSACDILNGNIYVTWANIGVPGVNSGSDIDVYIIRSEDGGDTWNTPVRVNQDPVGQGKEHYFPWITCDPQTGAISAVFYDDRNVSSSQCETFCANSFDGGDTWEDFKVSDVAFTPSPIGGLAGGYMGDYLSISAIGGYVYPCWTDKRGSTYMAYTSPYLTNNLPRPFDLVLDLNEGSGAVDLSWDYDDSKGFLYFNVYRGDELLGTTTEMTYTDNLPDYGVFMFKVTAMHDDGESAPVSGSVQWGNPQIDVNPMEVNAALAPGESTVKYVTISNIGELDLTYDISPLIDTKKNRDYCSASGGCDEFISRVEIGDINNSSSCGGYEDYTDLSTIVNSGETYDLTIDNGNVYSSDDNGVWVDWNQDGDFDDAGEEVVCDPDNGQASITYSITIPDDALAGETTMRIRMKYSGGDCGDPCGATTYGEVEDYTLIVQGWLFVDPKEGTIAAGDSEEIEVTLDAADLVDGTYTASLNISSDDPDDPLVEVPITLVVGANLPSVVVNADPTNVCAGGGSQLSATGDGGTGTYTYSWTSDPEGFTSDEQNPYFDNITTATTFTCDLSDGNFTVSDFVEVTVDPLPSIPGTPSGNTGFCQDADNMTYTTTGADYADAYMWEINPASAGVISGGGTEGLVNWASDFSGTATITVYGVNDCGDGNASEGFDVEVYPLPNVVLEFVDDSLCIYNDSIPLNSGTPIGGVYEGDGVFMVESVYYFSPEVAGLGDHTITYTFTNENDCVNTAEAVLNVSECLGIDEFSNEMHLEIFPNPNNGIFTVKIQTWESTVTDVRVFNSIGSEVYHQNNVAIDGTFTGRFDLSDNPEGLYFVNIISEDINIVRKIILTK